MSPESQRIAIRKACSNIKCFLPDNKWHYSKDGFWFPCCYNDPLSDLNAMHEAEKVLTADQHWMFRKHLWEITDQSQDRSWCGVNGEEHNRRYCSATAAQRAEAFLRTLNLWKVPSVEPQQTKSDSGSE